MAEAATALARGDTAPWFKAAALSGSPDYCFDTVAGRLVLMLFFGSASFEPSKAAIELVSRERALFDDERAAFFGVSVDPEDVAKERIAQELPGLRYFLDFDRKVSRLYGASDGERYAPFWLLLDPALRVIERFPIGEGEAALALAKARAEQPFAPDAWAPVLQVADVLEPALCRHLIELYERDGGEASGFMRDVEGKTRLVHDPAHKQRRDYLVGDEALQRGLAGRIRRRLAPALARAFQFEATRMERYLVACYEAGAGHFRPHRDNTTKGTAHRRFAVTINLNSGDYEGGDLRFPEFGPRTYRAPTGGAIVFSCSLLHEAIPVTVGRRYAFLPFLYDDEAARLREANNPHLGDGVSAYRMGDGPGKA
ncbi:2OG-Fe(II) oxygenase [Allosphingosinicella sp.]|jgi:predicted 2-oxoglutarate/Fe(II)-dependent dioxygenase YbiX/peroxiredoxin|uniref:2OG-Fe(II) oxygenase n=1 Tax=Allosphingosinicella sp. TaxID=2823234 RepID=UPI002EF1892F